MLQMIVVRKLLYLLVIPVIHLYAQAPVTPIVRDKLAYGDPVTMTGYVGSKLDLSLNNRVLAQDVDRLIQPFNNRTEDRCWQSEFWGKWFTSAVLAYRYKKEPALRKVLDDAVAKLEAAQRQDGYIGNYAAAHELEQWDIWGRKYCMLGLIAYHDLTGDERSLQAARREADYLIRELQERKINIVQTGNHKGMASTSVLEPMVLLYARTGDKRYLDFAKEIVREWELPVGPQLISRATVNVGERFPVPTPWFGPDQGRKAYEMMSCYEGLLELYRYTGDESYRRAVEETWQNIRDTEINIAGSGSSMECWFGGKALQAYAAIHYQETCVTATWIKMSQQLLRLTGDAKYAETIERSFYNALLGSMLPDGSSWAKYSPILGIRTQGEDQCNMGLNCCVASGPRGLFTLPLSTVMNSSDGVAVNFFIPGTYHVRTPRGHEATVTITTDYPVSGQVSVRVAVAKPEEFTVRVRVPEWSTKTALTLNETPVQGALPGNYASISVAGNTAIALSLDMRGRIEKLPGTPQHLALVRGPVVLARDARLTGAIDIDEAITPLKDQEGFVPLEPVSTLAGDSIWMAFRTPCLAGSYRAEADAKPVPLIFCDYASAGDTYSERSRFRVWLPQLIDLRKSVSE